MYGIHFMDKINSLNLQIMSLLDLIECCDADCIDIDSIKTAAGMCTTMQHDLMDEVRELSDNLEATTNMCDSYRDKLIEYSKLAEEVHND